MQVRKGRKAEWTNWQGRWQKEKWARSKSGWTEEHKVKVSEMKTERGWPSETEGEGVWKKHAAVLLMCWRKRKEKCCWMQGSRWKPTVVDLCQDDRQKNNAPRRKWRVVTVLWMSPWSPCRTLGWGIRPSLQVLPALYWTTITQRWPQPCLRPLLLLLYTPSIPPSVQVQSHSTYTRVCCSMVQILKGAVGFGWCLSACLCIKKAPGLLTHWAVLPHIQASTHIYPPFFSLRLASGSHNSNQTICTNIGLTSCY